MSFVSISFLICLDALEVLAEGAVELVEVRLILDQHGAREDVEIVDAVFDDVLLQCFEQVKELLDRNRQAVRLEVQEEVDQHRRLRSGAQRLWRAMKIRRSKR